MGHGNILSSGNIITEFNQIHILFIRTLDCAGNNDAVTTLLIAMTTLSITFTYMYRNVQLWSELQLPGFQERYTVH